MLNSGNLKVLNDFYKAQVKTQLQRTIMDAIQIHRSPVAIAWDAHKEAHPVRTGEEILKNSKSVSVLQI